MKSRHRPSSPDIPADVKRILRRRHLLPFLLYFAWLIVLASVSVFVIYPNIVGTDSMIVAPTILVTAIILPIFPLKLPAKLVDRTYRGVVRSCKPYDYREPVLLRTMQYPRYIPRTLLVIQRDDGKLITLDLPLPDPYAPPPWKEGDRVARFQGSPLLFLAEELPTTCILCGGRSPEGSERCVFCHHSLIRSSYTFQE